MGSLSQSLVLIGTMISEMIHVTQGRQTAEVCHNSDCCVNTSRAKKYLIRNCTVVTAVQL